MGATGNSIRWFVLLLTAALLTGCPRPATAPGAARPGASAESGGKPALLGQAFRFRFLIYTKLRPGFDIGRELRAALAGTGFGIAPGPADEGLPPSPTSVFFAQPKIEEFPLPDADSLEHFVSDMTEAEMRQLAACRGVTIFEVAGAASRSHEDYNKALTLAEKLATKLDGFIWDAETRIAYTVRGWAAQRDGWQGQLPDVTRHVTIHSYRDGELMRLVSLGMVKFGLPDVAVNDVSSTQTNNMGNLLNLIMQRLLEGEGIDQQGRFHASIDAVRLAEVKQHLLSDLLPSAKRELVVSLSPSPPAEGDADNRLLVLVFPGDPKSLQERHSEAIASLFGAQDGIAYVKHDAALLAASERARKKLFALKPNYAEAPPYGEVLLVKAPFVTPDGGNEWMWVEVVRWKGDTIDGILKNDAYEIPELKDGARVQIQDEKLFDYILTKRDGSREGNETGPLLEQRAKGSTRSK